MDEALTDGRLLDFGPPRKRKRGGGPSSPGGKKTISQNARKHGCRAQEKILPGERREDYDAVWAQWLDVYVPESEGDLAQLEQVVDTAWRLQRAERAYTDVERALLAASGNAAQWTAEGVHRLGLMQRYRTSAENAFHKALRMLEFLKGKREAEGRERERRAALKQAEEEKLFLAKKHYPELVERHRKAQADFDAAFAASRPAPTRAELLFRGQNAVPAQQNEVPLEQWAEIRMVQGRAEAKLTPSNEELLEQGKAMLPPPSVVLRHLNFPQGIPAEYAWVGVREAEARKRGGSGTQRMSVDAWLELIEREQAAGQLLAAATLPRAEERQACACPACVTGAEMRRQNLLRDQRLKSGLGEGGDRL